MDSKKQGNKKNAFADFTNLYELSKTLRFELKPLCWDRETKEIVEDKEANNLKKYKIVEKDEQTAANIEIVKFYLNILHREFILKSLEKLQFEKKKLEEYYLLICSLDKIKKDTSLDKDKKEIERKKIFNEIKIKKKDLLEDIGGNFSGYDFLLSEDVKNKLKERFTKKWVEKVEKDNRNKEIEYPGVTFFDEKNEEKSVFDIKFGYLKDFNKNRKHLYAINGKKGALATRILDNFKIFVDNKKIFEDKYKNLSDINFSETESYFNIELNEIFDLSFFNSCFTQEGIDKFNEIVGGIAVKEERKKIKGINEIINLYVKKKEQEYKNKKYKKGDKKFNVTRGQSVLRGCLAKINF